MKYYYKIHESGNLKEFCPFDERKSIKIGSMTCTECYYCLDYSNHENWVICKKLTIKGRKRKLNKLIKN